MTRREAERVQRSSGDATIYNTALRTGGGIMRKMRALRAPHVRFALLLGTAFALASPASAQLGTVTHADAEMPVEDAVAVWDPERPQLRLYLFPFELTPRRSSSAGAMMPMRFAAIRRSGRTELRERSTRSTGGDPRAPETLRRPHWRFAPRTSLAATCPPKGRSGWILTTRASNRPWKGSSKRARRSTCRLGERRKLATL